MQDLPIKLMARLDRRNQQDALRSLDSGYSGVDFCSNDYLGFSAREELVTRAVRLVKDCGEVHFGATGSRLISGNHALYATTEAHLKRFFKADAALMFNSGYDANTGLIGALAGREDLILFDEYVHASIREGIALSGAKSFKFRHNNLDHLKELLLKYTQPGREVYVITESVFSMDGDAPDLVALVALCKDSGCRLVIDEAHAAGVFGAHGEGLVVQLRLENEVFARVVTFGKAFGAHGAAVLGSEALRSYLINFSRPLIYTTALPPLIVGGVSAAISLLEEGDHTWQLRQKIDFFRTQVRTHGLEDSFVPSLSAIQCVICPGNSASRRLAARITQGGFRVKAILAPTVPEGSERIRICIHIDNTEEQIISLLRVLKENMDQA